jgi:hypothetical protein
MVFGAAAGASTAVRCGGAGTGNGIGCREGATGVWASVTGAARVSAKPKAHSNAVEANAAVRPAIVAFPTFRSVLNPI